MKFNFENLDEDTRQLMLDEIKYDAGKDKLYFSRRFNEVGIQLYPNLLQLSVTNADEEHLASCLKNYQCFKEKEERTTKSGKTFVKIPITAHQTFADGEFNRFYIRALCIRAIRDGQLKIYRAKYSANPRRESENIVNTSIDPTKLLEDLRNNIGVDTALGLPPGSNSGLSVKLAQ